MILTFTVILIFNLLYNSIGKELQFSWFRFIKIKTNQKFRNYCIESVEHNDNKALKFTQYLFAGIGFITFCFYAILSRHPWAISLNDSWMLELFIS